MKIRNIFFGMLMAIFAFSMLVMMPPQSAHATQPPPTTVTSEPTEAVSAPQSAEVSADDTTDTTAGDEPAPPTGSDVEVDLDWLMNKENAIASILFLVLTFLSKWIPGINKIGDTGKRALTVGATVIVGFLAYWFFGGEGVTWSGFFSLGVTYLLTSLGYDKAIKPAGLSTPKVATA